MWTCPNCKKQFRNKNQWHSCARLNIEDHFINKDENARDTFNKIVDTIKECGEFEIIPIKTSIQFKTTATFLSVRVKKDHLILELQLDHDEDDICILKKVRVSSKRVFYMLVVDSPQDISDKIKSWLQQAYNLITN